MSLDLTALFGVGLGPLIVLVLRLVIPLTIFKKPFWGIIFSLIIDALDVIIVYFIGLGTVPNYHNIDKILDTYYLTIALIVSLKWQKSSKYTAIILFVYRIIGVIGFELTDQRIWLFIFQNLFENFFIFESARQKFFPKWKLTKKRLIISLILLEIPKMIQEWVLHYAKLAPSQWLRSIWESLI